MRATAGFSSSFPALSSNHSPALLQSVADAVGCLPEQVAGFDAFLVDALPPCVIGASKELLNGQNVDAMSASLVSLFSLIDAGDPDDGFRVFVALDGLQFGRFAADRAGSVSSFVPDVAARMGITKDALSRSQMISVENSPAAGFPYAAQSAPGPGAKWIGEGIVAYRGTAGRMVTSLDSRVLLTRAAKAAGVPLSFVSDAVLSPAEATVERAVSAALGVQIGLIGIPVMGQGSVRETVAMVDVATLYAMVKQLLVSWTGLSVETVE
jgi:aspartyl aminopeptidase